MVSQCGYEELTMKLWIIIIKMDQIWPLRRVSCQDLPDELSGKGFPARRPTQILAAAIFVAIWHCFHAPNVMCRSAASIPEE